MAYFSLSIYSISINKRNKPEEHEFLDCFDEGKSLMDMIDNLFKGWHKGRHISEIFPVGSHDVGRKHLLMRIANRQSEAILL